MRLISLRRSVPIPDSLRMSDLANHVPIPELRAIERRGTNIRFDAGRVAMRQADVGRECMIVVHGAFAVERNGDGVAVLQAGTVMGEMALLNKEPRTATVTALEDSEVYVYNRRDFVGLLRECPALAEHIHADMQARTIDLTPGKPDPLS